MEFVRLYVFDYLSISGIYECQVSTTPPRSHLVHLDVAGKLPIFVKYYRDSVVGHWWWLLSSNF